MSLSLRATCLGEAGFRHGFFMRGGGKSPKPWDSLNFSSASGDLVERVNANVDLAAAELGVTPDHVYFLSQVHGTAARFLDGSENRKEMLFEEGDITVSGAAGVACAVRMADCAAVLLADTASGSVAAVHSGWRGTVQNAVAHGVAALREQCGDATQILAAVGPHIERCCFEVGEDVVDQIKRVTPLGEAIVDRDHAKPHIDLRAVIDAQLVAAGVARVEHVRGCTMCDPTRFHSYRRDGKRSGRMLGAIVARG